MKKLLLSLALLMSASFLYGQNIGLRVSTELSDTETANKSIGYGIYINFNDLTDRFEATIYGDFARKNDRLSESEEEIINYEKHALGIAALYRIHLTERKEIKIGPDISYNWIEANHRGRVATWWQDHRAYYLGLGIMANLHFREIFQLPLNFDLFVTPAFRARTGDPENNSAKTMNVLNIQFGLTYQFNRFRTTEL